MPAASHLASLHKANIVDEPARLQELEGAFGIPRVVALVDRPRFAVLYLPLFGNDLETERKRSGNFTEDQICSYGQTLVGTVILLVVSKWTPMFWTS